MPIASMDLLEVGARVAYEDQANPRSEGRIAAVNHPDSQYMVEWSDGPRAGGASWSDCRQHGWTLLDLTGIDIIHAYTRAQAVRDGVLGLLDGGTLGEDMPSQAGWRHPAAMTRTMWDLYVEVPEGTDGTQDTKGRLWDILWMAAAEARLLKARGESGDRFLFKWYVVTAPGRRQLVTGKVVVGPTTTPTRA